MKNQSLFSSKDKSKKLKCRLPQFLFNALRVNPAYNLNYELTFQFQPQLKAVLMTGEIRF